MKYKVGDLLLLKNIEPALNPIVIRHPQTHFQSLIYPLPLPQPRLYNTLGVIVQAIKHSDIFVNTTESNNLYIWYSQIDCKEYYFCQDEIEGEVIV